MTRYMTNAEIMDHDRRCRGDDKKYYASLPPDEEKRAREWARKNQEEMYEALNRMDFERHSRKSDAHASAVGWCIALGLAGVTIAALLS